MIHRLLRLWCALSFCLLVPAAAGAAVLAEAEARAVRQVVLAQLDAFAADDAERAFSYASASIRAQFGDAADRIAASVRQAVQLRDREGRLWMATYLLERQPGNGWRISGCVVRADSGKSST